MGRNLFFLAGICDEISVCFVQMREMSHHEEDLTGGLG